MKKLLVAMTVLALAAACGDNNETKKGTNNTNNGAADMGTGGSDLGTADTGGGGGEDMPVETDTGGGGDDVGQPDMAAGDMGADDMGPVGPCDRNGMMFVEEDAYWDGFQFLFSGFTGDPLATGGEDMGGANLYDFLSFEVYPDFGGVVGPQDVTFTGLNYSECGTCLLIFADCTPGDACDKIFLVDSGEAKVSEMGSAQDDPFKAEFTQLEFSEVTVDPETYQSTKVVGGETYCVDLVTADTTTTDDSMM